LRNFHGAKFEEYPKPGQMLIGFLRGGEENYVTLRPEFRSTDATL